MARRPRADEPGTWHHVINRGLAKRPLFERRYDARFFLARLARQVRLGRLEIHAYSLLTTHFHLLVRSPIGELSEAMRQAQNDYVRRFNRRHRRDGALVRGRFFSKPVDSLAYRRTLVAYIDANAVQAGLVKRCEQYDLGSAAAHMRGAGPRWLSRDWITAEACRVLNLDRFTPAAYRRAFGTASERELEELVELVETRATQARTEDPLESLVGRAPHEVQAWMQRRAQLADGHRVGLAVCGRLALRRALDANLEASGPWTVKVGRSIRDAAELAWHGLLHDFAGCTWQGIARHAECSVSRSQRLTEHHRRLLAEDPEYSARAASVLHGALSRGARYACARA